MSRRHHHHHNLQPYDYDRITGISVSDHARDREQAMGIEYQDDSLSSINSDEDSYLHHRRPSKDKKPSYYTPKNDSSNKFTKPEKTTEFHQKEKEVKAQLQTSSNTDDTSERLSRLEAMLGELIKQNTQKNNEQKEISPPKVHERRSTERGNERRGQLSLEPRRHNFTTSMWINKIQEVSIQNNWDEKTTIQYMASQMSGIIKAWYNSLQNYDFTWPEWKILISKVFPDNTDFVTTLKRLVTRLKQADESITTYYFSKMYLIEACKISGEDAVSCLIDGLNNQAIQEEAKAQNFLTPETLYSQFLTSLSEYSVDYAPSGGPATTTEAAWNPWYYEEEVSNVGEVNEEDVSQEQFIDHNKEERPQELDYHIQGNPSFLINNEARSLNSPSKRSVPVHSRLDKRYIRRKEFRNQVPLAAKVCSVCFQRGHLAKNCRRVEKALHIHLSSTASDQCFFKRCVINGQVLDAFVDTGCTTITIKEEEAQRLKLKVKLSHKWIQAYGGGSVPILGETEVLLTVDSVQARVRAVIVPNHVQDVSVIIGQEFLSQKNVGVYLKNNTLKIFEAFSKLTD